MVPSSSCRFFSSSISIWYPASSITAKMNIQKTCKIKTNRFAHWSLHGSTYVETAYRIISWNPPKVFHHIPVPGMCHHIQASESPRQLLTLIASSLRLRIESRGKLKQHELVSRVQNKSISQLNSLSYEVSRLWKAWKLHTTCWICKSCWQCKSPSSVLEYSFGSSRESSPHKRV